MCTFNRSRSLIALLIAILSYANTDELRKLVIEYIEHTKNVSSAEINLLAIDLRNGGEENYNKYWKKK